MREDTEKREASRISTAGGEKEKGKGTEKEKQKGKGWGRASALHGGSRPKVRAGHSDCEKKTREVETKKQVKEPSQQGVGHDDERRSRRGPKPGRVGLRTRGDGGGKLPNRKTETESRNETSKHNESGNGGPAEEKLKKKQEGQN